MVGLTAIVTLIGAAGIYAFERKLPESNGISDYGTALWWTAMLMTTIGSDYFRKTASGRVLCCLLGLYAIGVCGYLTARLATFFIDRDAENDRAEIAGAKSIQALQAEITALRTEIQALTRRDLNLRSQIRWHRNIDRSVFGRSALRSGASQERRAGKRRYLQNFLTFDLRTRSIELDAMVEKRLCLSNYR